MNQANQVGAKVVTQEAQVEQQMREMDDVQNELHKAVLQLDERLSLVLTNPPEEKPAVRETPTDLVPLANILWNKNDFLRLLLERINNLRQRIEL